MSIGIAAVTGAARNLDDVLSNADMACYAAKDAGRNRVHVFQPDDSELVQRRGEMRWVARIRKAIEEDRFCLYYQPIVPVANPQRPSTSKSWCASSTSRVGWCRPWRSFRPPSVTTSCRRWTAGCCSTALRFRERTQVLQQGVLVINLSGQSLCDDQFLEFVVGELGAYDVAPRVCFEITETAAIANLRRAVHFLDELKALGCRFALDDFGSGLSSFAYLKNLQVDYLKIDGSFVKDIVEDPIDRAMVEAINQIGHVMGIQTIAEFVESSAVMEALERLGVDFAQGYWIAPPRPLADLDSDTRTADTA